MYIKSWILWRFKNFNVFKRRVFKFLKFLGFKVVKCFILFFKLIFFSNVLRILLLFNIFISLLALLIKIALFRCFLFIFMSVFLKFVLGRIRGRFVVCNKFLILIKSFLFKSLFGWKEVKSFWLKFFVCIKYVIKILFNVRVRVVEVVGVVLIG